MSASTPPWRAVVLVCALAACTGNSVDPTETPAKDQEPIAPNRLTTLAAPCATPDPAWVFCDDFEVNRLTKYFEFATANGSFARVTGVGRGGSVGMRAHFNAGQVNAGALHLAFGKTPQAYMRPADGGTAKYRELWWRFYLRYQPGWTGGGGWKIARMTSFPSSTSWAQAMVGYLWSGGTGQSRLLLHGKSGTDAAGKLMTTQYNDVAHFRDLGAVASPTQWFLDRDAGRWLCIEGHIRLNRPGYSDGVFEFWVNGNVEGRKTGLNWVGSYTTYGMNALFIENYWNTGSPKAQNRYFDNLIVSIRPIGC